MFKTIKENFIKNKKKIIIIGCAILFITTLIAMTIKISKINNDKESLDYYEIIDSYYEEENIEDINNIEDIDYNNVSEGIEIQYIDNASGQKISSSEFIYGMIGDEYDLTNQIKNIDGYHFLETDGEVKGTLQKSKQTLIYKYLQ